VSAPSQEAPKTSLVEQLLEEYFPFSPPRSELPDATPAEGPDPYGNPEPEWLGIDWREHLRHVDLDGARVNYVEVGSGPRLPTVFVHGLSGSWQNWLENIPHFAREHRVLALDLPGFGHSPMPEWEISIERYGRLLHDFCEKLGVRDCAVVGNSMGGFISAEAAAAEPGRFEKLVLVSAAGISHARLRRQPAETLARMATAAAPLLLKLQERGLHRPRVRWATFKGLFQHPESLRLEVLLEQFQNGAGRPGFLPAVQGLFGYDILDQLSEVEVPTLIVWGRNDLPQLERPTRFNRILETFLAG
jgi:pimeloyl-ACP methyl ester carboxylesterase